MCWVSTFHNFGNCTLHYYVLSCNWKGWIGGPKVYYEFSFSGYILNVEDKVGFYFLVEENVDLLIKNGTKNRDEVLLWALMHYHDSSCGHGGLRPHISILRNIITQIIIIIIRYKHHLQFNKFVTFHVTLTTLWSSKKDTNSYISPSKKRKTPICS